MITLSSLGESGFMIVCENPTDEETERFRRFFGCDFQKFMRDDNLQVSIEDIENCQKLAVFPECPDEPVLDTERIKQFAECFGKADIGDKESPFTDVFVFSPAVTSALTGKTEATVRYYQTQKEKQMKEDAFMKSHSYSAQSIHEHQKASQEKAQEVFNSISSLLDF